MLRAALESGYALSRIDEFIDDPRTGTVILRHDVDRFPANALAMAELEQRLGVRSTYYVRKVASAYSDTLVTRLHELDHEVGYHYEVLSKTGGRVAEALELFARELAELRALAPIRTAASHGSPFSPWDSLSIWEHTTPQDFDLIGEPYLQIDYARVGYYTDTGRSWSADAVNLRDRAPSAEATFPRVRTSDQLIALLCGRECDTLCIQTHPERWNPPGFARCRSMTLDWAANCAKRVIRATRSEHAR